MEIPEKIKPFLQKSDAILLENHGALTLGSDLFSAYHKMETLEHTANIVWKAIQLGNVNVLTEVERDRLMTLRERFNLTGKISLCDCTPLNLKQ
jgi:L-fuculose-phosphate aldolase